jgi:hypothetical protein
VAASCKHDNLSLRSVEGGEFLSIRATVSLQLKTLLHEISLHGIA